MTLIIWMCFGGSELLIILCPLIHFRKKGNLKSNNSFQHSLWPEGEKWRKWSLGAEGGYENVVKEMMEVVLDAGGVNLRRLQWDKIGATLHNDELMKINWWFYRWGVSGWVMGKP